MNVYTVGLFGHRRLDRPCLVEEQLLRILKDLFSKHEFLSFLVGRNGDFDLLAAATVRRAMQMYGKERAELVLILPYPTAEWQKNQQAFLNYYGEVELCDASCNAFYKGAIQTRNRKMVERSDLVVCWVEREVGGAFQTIRYAKTQGKAVLNLAQKA